MKDKELIKIASTMRNGGANKETTINALKLMAGGAPDEEIGMLVETLYKPGQRKNWDFLVTEFVATTDGYFKIADVYRAVGAVTPNERAGVRMVLSKLVKDSILVRQMSSMRSDGVYRLVGDDATDIDWKNANPDDVLPVRLPFGLHQYFNTYRKNIFFVAGDKSAGKSAFVNDFIKINQNDPSLGEKGLLPIRLLSSEVSPEELASRLRSHTDIGLDEWDFEAKDVTSNFSDYIMPDKINVIDWLESDGGEYYLIGDELKRIYKKLNKGMALVMGQKADKKDLAIGGVFTIHKPRLYLILSFDPSGQRYLYVKDMKNLKKGAKDANGLKIYFRLIEDGSRFVKQRESWPTRVVNAALVPEER